VTSAFESHSAEVFTAVFWMTILPVRTGTRLCAEMHEVSVSTLGGYFVCEAAAGTHSHLLGQRTLCAWVGWVESGSPDCIARSSWWCRRRHDLAGFPAPARGSIDHGRLNLGRLKGRFSSESRRSFHKNRSCCRVGNSPPAVREAPSFNTGRMLRAHRTNNIVNCEESEIVPR
jgi:hypothetical protein